MAGPSSTQYSPQIPTLRRWTGIPGCRHVPRWHRRRHARPRHGTPTQRCDHTACERRYRRNTLRCRQQLVQAGRQAPRAQRDEGNVHYVKDDTSPQFGAYQQMQACCALIRNHGRRKRGCGVHSRCIVKWGGGGSVGGRVTRSSGEQRGRFANGHRDQCRREDGPNKASALKEATAAPLHVVAPQASTG